MLLHNGWLKQNLSIPAALPAYPSTDWPYPVRWDGWGHGPEINCYTRVAPLIYEKTENKRGKERVRDRENTSQQSIHWARIETHFDSLCTFQIFSDITQPFMICQTLISPAACCLNTKILLIKNNLDERKLYLKINILSRISSNSFGIILRLLFFSSSSANV